MSEIIKVTDNNGKKAVSARDLYAFLQVQAAFTHWCKRMFEYGFEEGRDFMPILAESSGGRPSMDYALSIDCAKEISMLQRTERGKQARQYFIDMEKKALAVPQLSTLDLLELTIKNMREQRVELDEIKSDVQMLKAQTITRPNFFTAAGFLTVKGVNATIEHCSKLGKAATKYCREKGLELGKIPDPRFGHVNTYPEEALSIAFQST